MRFKRIQNNGVIVVIIAFLITAIFIAANSDNQSKEMNNGFLKLETIIARQDSTLRRQNTLIEQQSGKIHELEITIETLQKSNEEYKHELDSVYSIINYMQRNYIHKRALYERFSPND